MNHKVDDLSLSPPCYKKSVQGWFWYLFLGSGTFCLAAYFLLIPKPELFWKFWGRFRLRKTYEKHRKTLSAVTVPRHVVHSTPRPRHTKHGKKCRVPTFFVWRQNAIFVEKNNVLGGYLILFDELMMNVESWWNFLLMLGWWLNLFGWCWLILVGFGWLSTFCLILLCFGRFWLTVDFELIDFWLIVI